MDLTTEEKYIFGGFLCASLALMILPPVMGLLAVYFGYKLNNDLGEENIGAAIIGFGLGSIPVGMLLGFIISAAF